MKAVRLWAVVPQVFNTWGTLVVLDPTKNRDPPELPS
jgi:hypothetical protein